MSPPVIKEQGEPIHYLIKMEIGAGLRRPRELLKQEARDLIHFSVSPVPHRKISYSNICEVDEKRLRELGPATDLNRGGSGEIDFYSSLEWRGVVAGGCFAGVTVAVPIPHLDIVLRPLRVLAPGPPL